MVTKRIVRLLLLSVVLNFAPLPLRAGELTDHRASDRQFLLTSRDSLRQVIDFGRSRPDIFGPTASGRLLTRQEKMAAWSAWSRFIDSLQALDALRAEHGKFLHLSDKSARQEAFQLTYGAFLASYSQSLDFIALVNGNPDLAKVLNEEVPELGLPAGTYSHFKFYYLNVSRATEFTALETLAKLEGTAPPELATSIAEDRAAIWRMGQGKGHAMTAKNALAVVGDAGFHLWFPLQKGVSTWMGDTRLRRGESALISAEQVKGMPTRLQPGDILLERREWYLSNLGLPGFWTHAALYVGTPEERRAFFADPDVQGWVRQQGGEDGDLEGLLRGRYPKAYEEHLKPQGDGHLSRVLEAISEGVSFTTIEHSGAADSLAVLRPRLTKQEKAVALLRAFHYSGRPYDFNFDFLTDSSLVCSELIYKVYEAGEGMSGLRFDPEEIMGRRIVTPNGMAQGFDHEQGKGSCQSDLVLFFDGYERTGRAVEGEVAEFRQSWRRPKWYAVLKEQPKSVQATHGR
jgi:hypothetical protein